MAKLKNNNRLEELKRQNSILQTKVSHLTNDLRLTKEENETSTKKYFELYGNLEQKIEERTEALMKLNKRLIGEIQERKRAEKALNKLNEQLEARIANRTADIAKANEVLRAEIFERKRTEMELQKSKELAEIASQAKSEFLANMGHELRTPLNHIIGFTELVVDKNLGDLNEIQEEYLKDVVQSSRHLLSLINDILDYSKLNAGEAKLKIVDVDIKMLFRDTMTMIKEKAAMKHIKILTDTDRAPKTIKAEKKMIMHGLYHLLSNAVKFTPAGGTITLAAKSISEFEIRNSELKGKEKGCATHNTQWATGDFLEISVKDTGIGIQPEDQARIFNVFEQGDASSSKKYQGSGLGLSMTKQIVNLLGGKIWVKSKGEGDGSIFCFVIPL
jgi:signal transduction histidine kinase